MANPTLIHRLAFSISNTGSAMLKAREESAYHWAEILRCLEQIEALRRRERGEDGFDG